MTQARVLIVDDDADILDLVQDRLARAGIPADIATSAERALAMMRENLYVAAVADIHMPGIDGAHLISALKNLSPLVQVIMLTSDSTLRQVVDCADRGAVDFFAKSQNLDDLIQSVRDALQRIDRWMNWMGFRDTQGAEVSATARGGAQA